VVFRLEIPAYLIICHWSFCNIFWLLTLKTDAPRWRYSVLELSGWILLAGIVIVWSIVLFLLGLESPHPRGTDRFQPGAQRRFAIASEQHSTQKTGDVDPFAPS